MKLVNTKMSTPAGYGELIQCPYEKAHRIQAHAMSKHLFKCRKNHPNQKLVSCPFNESHRVNEKELKLHVQSCEDRASFETYKYCIASKSANAPENNPPELVYNNSPPKDPFKVGRYSQSRKDEDDDENWDDEKEQKLPVANDEEDECWDDMNVPAYNPQKYCEQAKVIRKATLKAPAEKKAFYEAERLRLQNLRLKD